MVTYEREDSGAEDLNTVGSKFRNLAILSRNDFAVPPAFCVGTNALTIFLTANAITEEIDSILMEIDFDETALVNDAARRIRNLIIGSGFPAQLTAQISESLAKLGAASVSVRSSSTAEDLGQASFAGVYESYLNVVGIERVLDKIKDCWASAFSPRALCYYQEQIRTGRIAEPVIAIGVIVQSMIRSEKSGICFTVNPATSRSDELVIQAAFGLGEGAVSGEVPSDVYVADKKTGAILTCTVAPSHAAIVPDQDGGVKRVGMAKEQSGKPVLNEDEIGEIRRTSTSIEALFGSPQDVEWAIDSQSRLYVLQSRPITTITQDDLRQ
jgi:pyruvate,water dikinase